MTNSGFSTKCGECASIGFSNGHVAVLRVPMGSSQAIPVGISSPQAIELLTWCFYNFEPESLSGPYSLLVLGIESDGYLMEHSRLAVRTHFGERLVGIAGVNAPLSEKEITVLARAVLTAIDAKSALSLSMLFPVLASEFDVICATPICADLAQTSRADQIAVTGNDFIPELVIARLWSGYTYHRVKSLQIRSGLRVTSLMTLDPPLHLARLKGAILTGTGRHMVARFIGAA